jgi:hypothetical protein
LNIFLNNCEKNIYLCKNKKIKEMKKLIYLIALTALITACGKDEFTNNPNNIIGNWKIYKFTTDADGNPIDFDKAASYVGYDVNDGIIHSFLRDTTCGYITMNDGSVTGTYSYNIDNVNIHLKYNCYSDEEISRVIPYKLQKNILIMATRPSPTLTTYRFYNRIE